MYATRPLISWLRNRPWNVGMIGSKRKIHVIFEELLRRYSVTFSGRVVTRDIELRGVQMKKHDRVICVLPACNFDPEVFPESPEAQKLGRKLILQPGPNNPVGVAWIGLDKPGYGIHGTPSPEQVGRTESHGCFRLANWNAEHLIKLVSVGTPVLVEP